MQHFTYNSHVKEDVTLENDLEKCNKSDPHGRQAVKATIINQLQGQVWPRREGSAELCSEEQ